LFYLSRNVKTSARKRKPLKLQTRIIASIVAFDDVLLFNVDDVWTRKSISAVVRIYSVLILVSSWSETVVGYSDVGFVESIRDFIRTRNADVRDECEVGTDEYVVVAVTWWVLELTRKFDKINQFLLIDNHQYPIFEGVTLPIQLFYWFLCLKAA
jgi:hypothetical protein